jgi:hypothetical protein
MKHFDNYLPKEAIEGRDSSLLIDLASGCSTPDVDVKVTDGTFGLIDAEFVVLKDTQVRSALHMLRWKRLNNSSEPLKTVFSSPLLPSRSAYEPFVPDGDHRFIQSFSDTASLLGEDIAAIEGNLAMRYEPEGSCHYRPETPPESSPLRPLPRTKEQGASSLKLEVPLLPMDRHIGSSDDQKPIVLDGVFDSGTLLHVGATVTAADLEKMSDEIPFLSTEVATQVRDLGQQVLRRVEQERLHASSRHRVAVPTMDFTIQEPEWKRVGGSALAQLKSLGVSTPARLLSLVKSAAKEERSLRWRPLRNGDKKRCLAESLKEDKQELSLFLDTGFRKEIDSEMGLEAIRGRRTLVFLADPVEEIEVASSSSSDEQTQQDVGYCEPSLTSPKRAQQPDFHDATRPKRPKTVEGSAGRNGPDLLNSCDKTGIDGLLESYLQIRAPQKAGPPRSVRLARGPTGGSSSLEATPRILGEDQPHCEDTMTPPEPCPDHDPAGTASRYCVMSALGDTVVRQLKRMCPMTLFYVRGLDETQQSTKVSGTVRGAGSPLPLEADVVLSSSTGLVVTNVAQLRQRPLGHTGPTKLYKKIFSAATLYTKLIVLVSVPGRKLTSDDTRAYTEFTAFSAALSSTSIEAVLVGDGDECLAKWIGFYMNEYRCEGRRNEHLLAEEETSWERFCRVGGMNVYAAQVLAGALRASYGDEGLLRFIGMSADERYSAFEAIVGARRPLEAMSRWLEEVGERKSQ